MAFGQDCVFNTNALVRGFTGVSDLSDDASDFRVAQEDIEMVHL